MKLRPRNRWMYSTDSPRDMMLQLLSMGAGPDYEMGNGESSEVGRNRNMLDFILTFNAHSGFNRDHDDDDVDGDN